MSPKLERKRPDPDSHLVRRAEPIRTGGTEPEPAPAPPSATSGRSGTRTPGSPSGRTPARTPGRTDARPRGRAREDSANPATSTWRRLVEVEARRYAAIAARLAERDADLAAAVNAALAAGMDAADVRTWLAEAGATAGPFPAGAP